MKTIDILKDKYLEKRCFIYGVAGKTIIGRCLDISEHGWTFNTGTDDEPSYMTIPHNKYDIRVETKKPSKASGEDYAGRIQDHP